MENNCYNLDTEGLSSPKPYTPERSAEIDEINGEIADLFREICKMG